MAFVRSVLLVVVVAACMITVQQHSCSVVEAASIETFNLVSCDDAPTNTFLVKGGGTCQAFIDQGAVRMSEVSADTRVTVHNQLGCGTVSSVAQIFRPGCVVQGATKLRAVFIA